METLLKPSYCDAISENRNKSFGQYELRTRYPDRLLKSSLWVMGSFAACVLAGLWLSPELKADNDKIDTQEPRTFVKVELTVLDLDKGKSDKDPATKTPPPPEPPKTVDLPKTVHQLLPMELSKSDDQKIDTSMKPTPAEPIAMNQTPTPSDNGAAGIPTASGGGTTGGNTGTGTNGGDGGSEYGTENVIDYPTKDPEFEGNLESFLAKSTRYPGKAITEGIEGQVFVVFIVDETGKVVKPEIIKGIGYGCDEEALRVIKSLPRWKPGEMNGHPVKVRLRVPFKFKLANQ